ncbi:PREDICTED: protein NETWORKED 3A-like [Lupinus angustifolius]|uniref:protein NETWORKED 3A-like n=1 Tax=Lupinus angustifolius TaxID=3871 RepID=UPI00092E4897|nr:PREDICTED: protein NETWORKED 3A-like [Lupinus angustifolius]
MTQLMKNQQSQWWWLESHSTTTRSPWFQSTLNELNEKTKAMLKLIEEDADSFAKRAEMYYKKRPELIGMVEDFYRTHRSLAESYDQVKPDTGFRSLKIGGSQPSSPKKLLSFGDNGYDIYSENCEVEESIKSEVDDPEKEEEVEEEVEDVDEERVRGANSDNCMYLQNTTSIHPISSDPACDMVPKDDPSRSNKILYLNKNPIDLLVEEKHTICDEVMMLREEVERLRKENRAQKDQLKQKDEEKIKVIRQMSLAIDFLKQENVNMRSFIAKESKKNWKTPFDFNKLMGALSRKLFNMKIRRNKPSVVAL